MFYQVPSPKSISQKKNPIGNSNLTLLNINDEDNIRFYNYISVYSLDSPTEEVLELYKISPYSYEMYSSIVSVVLGLIFSYLTGPLQLGQVHPDLLCSFIRRFIPKTSYTSIPLRESQTVE
jgi:hypothetical protein